MFAAGLGAGLSVAILGAVVFWPGSVALAGSICALGGLCAGLWLGYAMGWNRAADAWGR